MQLLHQALQKIFPAEDILSDSVDLLAYSYDNSRLILKPDFVVFPRETSQIQATVKTCIEYQVPLVTRGRGTATTGSALANLGGVVLSTEKMNSIIKIDSANRFVKVQPGVSNEQLQKALQQYNLFWPPQPTSSEFCSIGGNLACNASGARSVKYGSVRDNILALKFIDGTGRLISSGKPVSKLSAGLELFRLLIGSEGMLGIIVEATLPLKPLSETSRTIRILCKDSKSATKTVIELMKLSNVPSALEFIDHNAFELIKNDIPSISNYENATMLLLRIDGDEANIEQQIVNISNLARGSLDVSVAKTEKESKQLWQSRKLLSPKLKEIAPKKINEDVVVPIANIAKLLDAIEQLQQKYQINIVNFGHAGNGNIHVNLLINPDDQQQLSKAHNCLNDLFKVVNELDGAISGEHGIGLSKMEFMSLEVNQDSLELMKNVKSAFDPHNILNPGKWLSNNSKAITGQGKS